MAPQMLPSPLLATMDMSAEIYEACDIDDLRCPICFALSKHFIHLVPTATDQYQ